MSHNPNRVVTGLPSWRFSQWANYLSLEKTFDR